MHPDETVGPQPWRPNWIGRRCIRAGVATRVYSVSLGGFDTHAEERASQQRLLSVDEAVTGFLAGYGEASRRP